MITVEQFQDRCKALYKSQQRMAAAKKWKSGRRTGTVRRPAAQIEFTLHDLTRWLWKRVGLNSVLCLYCHKPIDILSLTLDHVVPRSDGGRFCLDNMEVCCTECNERKGEISAPAFMGLLRWMRTALSPYDQNALLKRLKAANAGSHRRFWRDKNANVKAAAAVPSGDFFELPDNF